MKLNEWMMVAIPDLSYNEGHILAILRFLHSWNNPGFQDLAGYCMSWVGTTLDSARPKWDQYQLAGAALLVLEDYPGFTRSWGFIRPAEDTYPKVALRYLVLYHHVQGLDYVDSFPPDPDAAIIALQVIRGELSDERSSPKIHILDHSLVRMLAWCASEKDPNTPAHFRPLALEIFTLIGGMWLDPWVDDIPPDDKAQFIDALGNVLDPPAPCDTQSVWLLAKPMGNYEDMFEGRTASSVCRSPNIFLVPLLFGMCSFKSWQRFITKSAFSFMSHPSFKPDDWVLWLYHTLKIIASDSHLDIELMVARLKELGCYDVLALVIKSIWLSPDNDILPQHLWAWMEQETIELFKAPGGLGWRPLQGYFPIPSNTYDGPEPDYLWATPAGAARVVFHSNLGPTTQEESDCASFSPQCNFKAQQPPHRKIRRVCMMKRLCQVLKREIELEGLEVLDLLRMASNDGERIPLTDYTSVIQDFSYSV